MASNIFNFSDVHTIATSTELEATRGGAHIYDAVVTANIDNGRIVEVGTDLTQNQCYSYAMPSSANLVQGEIVRLESNGIYQVKVTSVASEFACLVLTSPVIKEGFNNLTRSEQFFFNGVGDIMRLYQLTAGDVFGVTVEGFSGTPEVGATVTVDTTTGILVVDD